MTHTMMASKVGAQDMGASQSFNLLLQDSKQFIQWDPPPQQDNTSSDGGEEEELVVLLRWLGSTQKPLQRYANLYQDRRLGVLRFVLPLPQLVGLHPLRPYKRGVANLAAMVATWCDANPRRMLHFHTFSHTGWLT